MALQIRRGTDSQRQGITPAEGELIYTTDTDKLYIGDGSTAGGIEVSGGVDSAAISAIISASSIDAAQLDGQNPSYYLDYGNLSNVPAASTDSSTVDSIVLNIVDSNYVQARETAQDFAYGSLTGTPTIPTNNSQLTNGAAYVTQAAIDSAVTALIGGAPGALDTLNELAAAINDDASFTSSVTTSLGLKANKAGDTFTGTIVSQHIEPTTDDTYDLGSTTKRFRDLYLGPGSLYINNKKVIEDVSGTITVKTDSDQNLNIKTQGTGQTTVQSAAGVNITSTGSADIALTTSTGNVELNGDVLINASNSINSTTSDPINFGDNLDLNSNKIVNVGTPTAVGDAVNKTYVDNLNVSTFTNDAGYLTSFTETNDLSSAVVWANVPNTNITEGSVTQHQAALSITESQISDLQSYLTSVPAQTFASLTSKPTTLSGYGITDGGTDSANVSSIITADVDTAFVNALNVNASTLNSQNAAYYLNYNNFSNTPTIPTNNNELTNGAGFITGYTVTQSDVTGHQAALTITESQISDLGTYLTSSSLTNYRTATQIESMIDSNVSAIVDAAPGALDTLNELAAALGDDANFSTTITNQIAAKIDSADAIAIIDSTHVQARQDKAYSSLTGAPTNLSDFTNGPGYLTAATAGGLDSALVSGIITADVDASFINALTIDADTLGGQNSAYHLDYTNFTNKPTIPTNNNQLTNGAGYTTNTGTVTPSSTDTFTNKSGNVSMFTNDAGYLTSFTETNDLSSAVTWANVPDTNITESSVTQHQAALSITESQISDLSAGTDSAAVTAMIDSSYVQARQAAVTGGATTVNTTSFTATANQTTFSVNYTVGKLNAYLNGILLDAADFTATNGTSVVLGTGADVGDILHTITYDTVAASTIDSTGISSIITADVDASFINALTIDADTLGGQNSAYHLDYTNFTNTPTIPTNNNQLTNGAGYLTSFTETNDLSSAVTWANIPDANVPQSAVTQHQAALSITESQISDLGTYLTSSSLTNYRTATQIESMIDSNVNAVVDAAPGALDTLNELAAALGDDANFSTTITNQIAGKLDSAQAIATITGSDLDMGGNKVLFGNVYSAESDLPNASSYHGMFAHVHATGAGYFAHGGNWIKLANHSELYADADVIALVDSAYVQARQTTGGGGTVDSADIITIVDSDYIQARQLGTDPGVSRLSRSVFTFTATANQTVFTGTANAGGTLAFNTEVDVYINGILLDATDYTLSGGNTLTLASGTGVNNIVTIVDYGGTAASLLDSAAITAIITADVDATFINALTIDADTLGGQNSAYHLDYTNFTNTPTIPTNNNQLTNGAGYLTSFTETNDLSSAVTWANVPNTNITESSVTQHQAALSITESQISDLAHTTSLAFSAITSTPTTLSGYGITDAFDGAYGSLSGTPTIPSLGNDFVDSAYVTTQVNAVIDAAPGALNTLNELAAALGDDANFSTTVTNQIAGKLDSAQATAVITGSDLDMGGNKVLFGNLYSAEADLPSASSYHGMFAHVHATGAGYFAHGGNWVKLANNSDIPTNNSGLTNGAGYQTASEVSSIITADVDAAFVNALGISAGVDSAGISSIITADVDAAFVTALGFTAGSGAATTSDGIDTTYVYTATANQTAFSGSDNNSATLSYTTNSILVYLNGILLVPTTDYTATNGTTVTLASGAAVNDEVMIVTVKSGPKTWTEESGTHTAVAGEKLFVDVSSATATITLPASPTMGDEVRVVDATGNCATNNITINRNSNNINGAADDLVLNINRSAIGLAYYNSTQGWVLTER